VTKVDGVYSKDPAKHDDAEKLHAMTLQQALEDPHVKVMDKAALGLAVDNYMPIVVCELAAGNMKKLVTGEKVGTLIS
jgi:uridylate kinase